MSTSKSPNQTEEDLISNVLDILPDKILELLPIRDAARTSMLSKEWRRNWLSLKRLVFDRKFFDDVGGNWEECSNVISSSVLSDHNGPVHEFSLYIPQQVHTRCKHLGQWLAFLSQNQVKWIKIITVNRSMPISPYIFCCSDLIYLDLHNFALHPPPSGFTGFPKLQHLHLSFIKFSQQDVFPALMTRSRKLAKLTLMHCYGMRQLVIHGPSLETLTIVSDLKCESIAFRNVSNLKSISVQARSVLGKPVTINTIDSFNNLASLLQLECIKFGPGFCEFLAAASIKRDVPIVFNHVTKLTLEWLALSSLSVLQNIFDMIESCPYMKEFDISIRDSITDAYIPWKLDTTKIHKSTHLVEVKITGVTGVAVELLLIEYLLNISVALERFFYKSRYGSTESELRKLSTVVSEIPRASPKARLVCLV